MMITPITMHELKLLMRSPFAWLAAGLMQLLFGWLLLSAIERYIALQATTAAPAGGITNHLIINFLAPLSVVFMLATPLLCMHLVAGEKQAQRFNFLLSLPVTSTQLIIGKFLGAIVFQLMLLALAIVLLATLAFTIELDGRHLLTAAIGLCLFIAVTTALTLFYSSLVQRPVLAAFLGFVTMALLWLGAATADSGLFQFISPSAHLHSFMQGLADTRDIAYFIAFTGILLALSVWRFDSQRARSQPV